ncbi:MAG: AAA family ATPase, partial [Colwellia sp.]|nr:AAA family ATPase [Colwellia sp.]
MIDNESEVGKYLKETGIDFTDKQLLYIKDVLLGSTHVSNWSVAGSGKSLCLEVIKNYLGDRCVVCASTGIANSILFDNKGGDGTLCRVMSIPTSMHTEYHTKKINSSTRKLLSGSDLVTHIFVEEAGMCNPDQIELLMKHVKRFNRAYGKKRKKRNIKVILQGDFLQLPNIVDDKEKPLMKDLYGGHTLFDSNILKTYGFSVHIFTKVLRTNDKTFQA